MVRQIDAKKERWRVRDANAENDRWVAFKKKLNDIDIIFVHFNRTSSAAVDADDVWNSDWIIVFNGNSNRNWNAKRTTQFKM